MISEAKATWAAELGFMLLKYYKTFDSHSWITLPNYKHAYIHTYAKPSRLHLGRGKTSTQQYDMKQFDGVAPVLELWGIWSNPSLPLLPGLIRSGVVELEKVQSMGQIELFDI